MLLLLLLFTLPAFSGAEEGSATPTDLENPEEARPDLTEPEERTTDGEEIREAEPRTETVPEEENAGGLDAREEEPSPEACAHEHRRTTIYFFDSPSYTAISPTSHRVSGAATVETVCEDCGALLSSEVVDSAEEVRPHSMKGGVCALCGYRTKVAPDPVGSSRQTTPGERIITAQPDDSGLFELTLSEEDLTALTNARVRTVLVRGKGGDAVIALDVAEMKAEAGATGANLTLELAEREDGSFFAGLYLNGSHGKQVPKETGVRLRFYRDSEEKTRFSVAPSDSETLSDVSADWNEAGYWSVPYVGEGTYFPLQ